MFGFGLYRTLKVRPEVLFVAVFEMFRQFAYMGLQVMMFLFLKHELKFSLYSAVALFHLFLGLSHVVSPLWSMLADEKLNRKCALLLATLLGLIGHVMVTLAAGAPRFTGLYTYDPPPGGFTSLKPHVVWLMLVGMALVAVGHGGPREITRALGADQFILPEEEHHLRNYYQIFFYLMSLGACAGILIAPVLRMQVECLGQIYCFPLSFGVLALAMLLAIVSLLAGWRRLDTVEPKGNPLLEAMLVVKTAWCAPADVPGSGLDKAGDVFTDEFIAEVRQTLRTLVLFIPLPLFWALMETMFSSWIYQGTRTTFRLLDKWHVEPDQMPVITLLTVYLAMPLLEHFIVCCRLHRRPLLRMIFGALLAIAAAALAMYVQMRIEPEIAYVPRKGEGQLLFIMGIPACGYEVNISYTVDDNEHSYKQQVTDTSGYVNFKRLPVKGFQEIKLQIRLFEGHETDPSNVEQCATFTTTTYTSRIRLILVEQRPVAVFLPFVFLQPPNPATLNNLPRDDLPLQDLDSCDLQLPKLYIAYTGIRDVYDVVTPSTKMSIAETDNKDKNMTIFLPRQFHGIGPIHLHPTRYTLQNNQGSPKYRMRLERGGVYIYVPLSRESHLFKLHNESTTHGGWQIKQFVLIGMAKFFLPITALEYSYQHVTVRMKPVLLSFWYISVALGNLLVSALASAKMFERDLYYYYTYVGLMGANLLITMIVACNFNRMIIK